MGYDGPGWNGRDAETSEVIERGFELEVDGRPVPGVYWSPAGATAERLVLLGHGGTAHQKIDYIPQVAQCLAGKGIATLAIDGPGHGDRAVNIPDSDPEQFAKVWRQGGDTAGILADWQASLDFVEAQEGARPTGWWGLSMGTMMGLPMTATDERIKVAVLGLMGTWGPNSSDLRRMAADVTCPVRFLVQWDDEVVPRDACLALFGLLGTSKKTLHANPGIHRDVPAMEVISSVEYLDRYLS